VVIPDLIRDRPKRVRRWLLWPVLTRSSDGVHFGADVRSPVISGILEGLAHEPCHRGWQGETNLRGTRRSSFDDRLRECSRRPSLMATRRPQVLGAAETPRSIFSALREDSALRSRPKADGWTDEDMKPGKTCIGDTVTVAYSNT